MLCSGCAEKDIHIHFNTFPPCEKSLTCYVVTVVTLTSGYTCSLIGYDVLYIIEIHYLTLIMPLLDIWLFLSILFYSIEFFLYTTWILDILYLILIIVTHLLMFRRFKISMKILSSAMSHNTRRPEHVGTWRALRSSRFSIAFLLTLSFMLFVVVPDTVFIGMHVTDGTLPRRRIQVMCVLNKMSWLSDVCVYVYMDRQIKEVLLKIWK